jgi:hypothetical protein
MVFPATGGARVSESDLKSLRGGLLKIATSLHFPEEANQHAAAEFDYLAGRFLHESMKISPGEAAKNDVWTFFALILVPDVATWRFPDQNERRLLGGVRNVFQRLWWRAQSLCAKSESDPYYLLRLPEDALVGLMERPAISSNSTVARTIARAIFEISRDTQLKDRENTWRDAFKRVRQRVPLVNLEYLDDAELSRQIAEICSGAIEEFRGR